MKRRLFFTGFLFVFFLPLLAAAAEVRDKADAEAKVTLYASMSATDAKALVDGFTQVYPKIDAEFYRTSDSQLMERMLTEGRAGRSLWDVVCETGFYGQIGRASCRE